MARPGLFCPSSLALLHSIAKGQNDQEQPPRFVRVDQRAPRRRVIIGSQKRGSTTSSGAQSRRKILPPPPALTPLPRWAGRDCSLTCSKKLRDFYKPLEGSSNFEISAGGCRNNTLVSHTTDKQVQHTRSPARSHIYCRKGNSVLCTKYKGVLSGDSGWHLES